MGKLRGFNVESGKEGKIFGGLNVDGARSAEMDSPPRPGRGAPLGRRKNKAGKGETTRRIGDDVAVTAEALPAPTRSGVHGGMRRAFWAQ